MACKFIVNGQESNLYNTILEAYNGDEESAMTLHSYFKNDFDFIKNFGNWEQDYISDIKSVDYSYKPGISRIEDNGEPKLFKNEKNGNYYYIDKDKNKIEIIENAKSLKSLFSNNQIERITKVLVNNYFKNNLKIDFENINLQDNSTSIRKSVVDKLKERITVFNASGDYLFEDTAELLEIALNENLDEIVQNVINSLETYKIRYSENFNDNDEDTGLVDIETNENEKDPGFGKASYEKTTKDNISANVKLRLSLIEDTIAEDEFLNDRVYKSFDEIYSALLPYLTNQIAVIKDSVQEDKFEILKSEILKFVNKKPYFKELYRILSQPTLSEEIKNEFTQAFSLDINNFNTSEYSYETSQNETDWITLDDGTIAKPKIKIYKNLNISETGKKETDIFNQWNKNFKSKFITEGKNDLIITKEAKDSLISIKAEINKIKFQDPESINEIIKVLRKLGIESTQKGFEHFVDDLKLINNDNELSEKKFNKLINDLNFLIVRVIDGTNTKYNNILSDQPITKQLAKAESFYISEGSDASVFTAGKQKWVYSYPSYLSNTIKSWKKDRNILLKHYEISKYNQGSDWMKYLLALDNTYQVDEFLPQPVQEQERILESQRRINELDLFTFNTYQVEGNSIEGKDNKTISKQEYISDTINKILGFTKGAQSFYRTTTPADKGTQYELAIGRNISTNARYGDTNTDIVVNEEVIDIIFNYFDAEYQRMKFEREFVADPNNVDKLITYYHLGAKNAFKSQLFPDLSFDKIEDTLNKSDLNFKNIYENGNAYLSTLKGSKFEQDIKTYIARELSNGIQDTLNSLIQNKIFEETSEGVINKELDDKIWKSYKSDNALKASADFFINSLISHVEYSKMFAGDVAYYKNAVDYKKRVPATYTDGLYQRLDDNNKEYTIAVIESVEINTPFLSELTELLGEDLANKYKDVNSADAQAWITPERWKNLVSSIGKWNATYDSAYEKLIGNNNEPFTAEELKAVAPPLKGVYFQTVNGVPTFLKYSQAVLSPRLRKGNELGKLYEQMITQEVDELLTFDAIKVGSNRPTKVHNDNGQLLDNIVLNPMKIPSNGWKLQQDLPIKGMHDTEVGSQIQKNIFQGLAFNLDKMFTLDNTEITGNEVIENISNVIGELSNRGYESILNEFGIDQDGKITNIEGFYNSIISELKSRGGSQNVIDALESEISIYGVAQAKDKLQNIFSSILTKRMLKIKTNGGSFIQMSNFGLNKENAEAQGVIWSPRALSTTHEPQFLKDKNDEFILSENGKKIIRPGGILLSGSFIAKYIPDYRKYIDKNGNTDKLFGYTNENGEFVEGVIDRKILENIIGYRIPNQGLSSNDALEIVGILPEETGDTVVAYTGITTKTGSDFDIDKMYLMFPSFRGLRKERQKLRDYAFKNLRGKTLQNTIDNITKVIDQLDPEDKLVNFDEERFAKILLATDNKELLNFELDNFVEAVLKSKAELAKFIKEEIPNYNNVEKLKYFNYDNSKPDSEQTKEALQNRLIELYKSVFLNENVIGEVMTPVDFDHIKKDIRSIAKQQPVTNLSTFNQLKDIDVKYSFLAGKAGVGQQANALMDYVLGSLANLSITNFEILRSNDRLDQEYSQELSQFDLDYYAKELNLSSEEVNKLKSVKISHSLSAILNAFVDIAKDPYITEGNWVTMTTNTGNLLLRKGVHPFYVNAFLAQPVIKAYVDFAEQYEASENQGVSTAEAFKIEYFGEDYQDIEESLIGTTFNKTNNLEFLRRNITQYNKRFQYDIFQDFLKYQSASKAIKINIDASKHMVNGVGGSVNSLMIAKNAVDSILDTERKYNELPDKSKFKGNIILGFESKFTNPNGSESMFSKYYKNTILKSVDIVKANPVLFLEGNETIQNTFNEISHSINNEILLDSDLGKTLNKTFYSYIMSGFNPLKISNEERRDLTLNFPKEFEQFKEDNLELYAIIDQMTVKQGETLEFVGLNNRKKSREFENSMISSFLDLINDEPDFADKLIKYSYLTSGFNNNSSQFFTMIPTQWFTRNNINRYITDSSSNYDSYNEINDDNFIDQFFLSNLENPKFVKNITDGQIEKESRNLNGFTMKKPGKVAYYRVKKDPNGINPPIYYKLIGYTNDFKGVYSRFITNIKGEFTDIKNLNVKDKKGNRIINFDTNGINLKEPSKGIAGIINKKELEVLNDKAVKPRDIFYRENIIIKKKEDVKKYGSFGSDKEAFDAYVKGGFFELIKLLKVRKKESDTDLANWKELADLLDRQDFLENKEVLKDSESNELIENYIRLKDEFGMNIKPEEIAIDIKPETEYIFDNEDDAIAKIEGQKEDGTFGGKQLPTGTIVKIKDSYFTVKNEVDEDIDLIPLKETIEDKSWTEEDKTVNIYAGTKENADLSNFTIRPFTVNVETPSGSKEFTFKSVEQGFHFYKAIVAENPTVGKKILETTNGGTLKSLTNRNNLPMNPEQVKEWDETSKSIMLNLMYDSYAQNPNEAQKLLDTGNATITHTQDNTRWKTDFPEVVMTVRDMLREEGFDKNNDWQNEDTIKAENILKEIVSEPTSKIEVNDIKELVGKIFIGDVYNETNDYELLKTREIKLTTNNRVYVKDLIIVKNLKTEETKKYIGDFVKSKNQFIVSHHSDGRPLSTATNIDFTLKKENSNKSDDWQNEDNNDTCVPF